MTTSQSVGFGPEQFAGLLMGSIVSVVLLAVMLPIVASLMLDGIILIVRGRGARALMVAAAMTFGVAVAGALCLAFGGEQSSAGFASSSTFLLPWTCALAAGGFVIRQVKGVAARRA